MLDYDSMPESESVLNPVDQNLKLRGMDHPQIRLWAFRMLFSTGMHKTFIREKDFHDDDLARMFGFGDIVDHAPGAPAFDPQRIVSQLRDQWNEAEQDYQKSPQQSKLFSAVRRFGKTIGLREVDCDILSFRITCEQKVFRRILAWLQGSTDDDHVETFAACLGYDEKTIRDALRLDGPLQETGIISMLRCGRGTCIIDAFEIIGCIADEIHLEHDDPTVYFRSRIVRSAPARLSADHFQHVSSDISVLSHYLENSLNQHRHGVNILIYGEPGSGKTEFTRMISSKLRAELFEVAVATRDGTVLSANNRFRAYRLGQVLLSRSDGRMILFDEIEDLFKEQGPESIIESGGGPSKAWVTKLMENNPVPSFWISNNIQMIDRAFLRRFDFVLEMNAPPRSIRQKILGEYLADIPISDHWKQKMAEHEGLVPALVERAAKVVRTIGENRSPEQLERAMSLVLGNSLDAMGLSREPRHVSSVGTDYRLDVLNTDTNIEEVTAGLREYQRGRVCLYGPPGTGKTAFGRYVAEILDRPLLIRRASDIISPWLGMTEKNLARIFRQANEENAVLLLDEADSFLQDRMGAQRSWEVTEVNEMLTQMESYEGIFIASTNLMASLDSAALRRFDVKIAFNYLKPGQAWQLFLDTRVRMGIGDDLNLESSVARLGLLTPGDFANVVRQSRLRLIRGSEELLQRLQAECAIKPEGRRNAIGFIS